MQCNYVSFLGAYGYTPLHECCYLGNAQICQRLLEKKANVDALSRNGSTPLLVASREGFVEIGEIIIIIFLNILETVTPLRAFLSI
jgi:ankyrin repeat protein